ncbi:type II toxin-antitoxin system Phd/YefM family antitoxin [Aphanothece sacrum]|uniref:Antitoxin n=1 Tax=Aphanothece sacrum FPU1 TaxID=1920663 RepID=A0A401IGN6_APHSA|nr:type II toxin-antitoxin system prevent-host-death family antitoxin [Aphanothece sacrum]GBF80360.1 prevent-host-death family protein [Aphanothece sacrum FPU1]GBF83767.1 prevent-host-death family protein [Aphanothece sacrum FPU3]
MKMIEVKELQNHIDQLIELTTQGEEIIITKANQPIAKLVSLSQSNIHHPRPAYFGSAKDRVWISDDFDEPLEDFQEYME